MFHEDSLCYRKKFIVNKVLMNIADDVEDEYISTSSSLNLIINDTDFDWEDSSSRLKKEESDLEGVDMDKTRPEE